MSKTEILVVDDNPVLRTLLDTVLGRSGFLVHSAACGTEAVEVFRKHWRTIQVVLLDVQLGEGPDGPDTLMALRQIDPGVRCCFMSADTGVYTVEQLLGRGALAFFSKPFADLNTLTGRLRDFAQRRQSA
jgi:CheY-like chemotaxis protein